VGRSPFGEEGWGGGAFEFMTCLREARCHDGFDDHGGQTAALATVLIGDPEVYNCARILHHSDIETVINLILTHRTAVGATPG